MLVNRSRHSKFLYLILIALLVGCSSSSSQETSVPENNIVQNDPVDIPAHLMGREFVGPVPIAEFLSIPAPSFQEVFAAYSKVIQQSGELTDSEIATQVFELLKADSKDRPRETQQRDFLDVQKRLNDEEWAVIFDNLIDAMLSYSSVNDAGQSAIAQFECEINIQEDSKLDALRHAYWNALMARRASVEFAELMATAHEAKSSDQAAKVMDLHNNEFGRAIEQLYPSASEAELLEILRKERYLKIERNAVIPTNYIGMIYYVNESPMDGRFSGSMTNPDAGKFWDIDFDFTQCGEDIKGQFYAESSGSYAYRRFDGTWIDGRMSLTVQFPFDFELRNPCRNMIIDLAGSTDQLSGSWSASNCPLGGEINISR